MWNTFRYTLRALSREKQIIIWVVIFPLVLGTLFYFMFSNISKAYTLEPIPTAIVRDAHYQAAPSFDALVTGLSRGGKGRLLEATFVNTEAEARSLLDKGKVRGYLLVDVQETPQVFVAPSTSDQVGNVEQTVLKNIADNYVRSTSTLQTIGQKNPRALGDPALVASLFAPKDFTHPLVITAHKATDAVRYYYALFGFLALMAANVALIAITNIQPNLSALGARRAAGGISRFKTLTATLAASWVLSFSCLLISFVYLRFVLHISFGGNDPACLLAFVVASLMATAFGTLIGVLPKMAAVAKGGILMGLICLLSLFAGLYGAPSMQLADAVARSAPLLKLLNPVRQISDLFYSLYFYDGYGRFFAGIGVLLTMSAVFFVCALFLMRRQRYASL